MAKPQERDERDVGEAIATYMAAGDDCISSPEGLISLFLDTTSIGGLLPSPVRVRAEVRHPSTGRLVSEYEVELAVRRVRR